MGEHETAQPVRNDGGQIPYHQAYFGCCNRTVMTREDIAQPKFCPFCGKAISSLTWPRLKRWCFEHMDLLLGLWMAFCAGLLWASVHFIRKYF